MEKLRDDLSFEVLGLDLGVLREKLQGCRPLLLLHEVDRHGRSAATQSGTAIDSILQWTFFVRLAATHVARTATNRQHRNSRPAIYAVRFRLK